MRRTLFLLMLGFAIGGCARQTPPETANKSSQSTQKPTTKASAKQARQSSVRFKGFSPDSKLFVVGFWHGNYDSPPGSLEIWDVTSRRKVGKIQFDAPVRTAVFLPSKNSLLVSAGKIYLCNLTAGHLAKKVVLAHAAEVMASSSDGKLVALTTNNDVEIRNVRNWKVRNRIKMESPRAALIKSMDFSPDGRHLLIGEYDVSDGIEVYDVVTGHKMWTAHGDPQVDVAWSPNDQRVAVATTEGVFLLQAHNGHTIKKFASDYGSPVWFSANGKQLFFTNKSTLVMCDAASGKVVHKTGIKNLFTYVISPDAKLLAHTSADDFAVQFRTLILQ